MKTAEKTRQLERLRNRSTAYELVLSNGTERFLLRYCGRSMPCQRKAIWGIGLEMIKRLGLDPDTQRMSWNPKNKMWTLDGTAWTAKLSGRTQREAICAGELPFILA